MQGQPGLTQTRKTLQGQGFDARIFDQADHRYLQQLQPVIVKLRGGIHHVARGVRGGGAIHFQSAQRR